MNKNYFVIGLVLIVFAAGAFFVLNDEGFLQKTSSGGNNGNGLGANGSGLVTGGVQDIVLTDETPVYAEAPYRITDTKVEGDELTVTFSTSGGCEEHDFIAYSTVLQGFMESSPVQANIYFIHEDNGDRCEREISKTIKYDLSPILDLYMEQYGRDDSIVFNLIPNLPTIDGQQVVVTVVYLP